MFLGGAADDRICDVEADGSGFVTVAGVTLGDRGEDVIARYEHHHEVGRLFKSIPVSRRAEALHVIPELGGVFGKAALALGLTCGFQSLKEGLGGCSCIDDELTPAR